MIMQYNTIQYFIQGIETKVTKYLSKGEDNPTQKIPQNKKWMKK